MPFYISKKDLDQHGWKWKCGGHGHIILWSADTAIYARWLQPTQTKNHDSHYVNVLCTKCLL